ncbi:TonB-dependent receptor domain-containing protein [Methyloversatilis discipulorum]|uniref:TonB-dependent receptor domain-containing protein n=1 Tax=Methyloversatilis discipulorum TaxID=1119528 RepID=UPI0026EF8238|nr:TonB-dependent receptor [Methyloversatilis discipulorum]
MTRNRRTRTAVALGLMVSALNSAPDARAQTAANTQIRGYDLPAGPLGRALSRFAGQSGITLSFDPKLTEGLDSRPLKGQHSLTEGFRILLEGSGLEVVSDGRGGYFLDRAAPRPAKSDALPALGSDSAPVLLEEIKVRAKRFHEIGPLPGLGLTREEIPGNVQSITAEEIRQAHSLSMSDLLNRKLQSVTVNDYQGNPFQMDVQYRGFTAGPQIGTPQGLSVFFDGIRVNEPFGDVVNWDMIPMNALAGVDVFPGSNPIFGLNTLGGAFTVKTKDGFNHAGFDAELLSGSYGRNQLQVEGGWNNGSVALFGAGNFFVEDGWRTDSPSKVNQAFGKASWRGERLDLNLSTLLVRTELVGNGLLPTEMYAQDRSSIYSSPDTTTNTLTQFQLSGAFQVSDSFSVTGQAYRRNSRRHQIGADVFTDYDELRAAKRLPAAGEGHTCLMRSTNQHGVPDYIVIPINRTAGENIYTSDIFNEWLNNNGVVDLDGKYAAQKNLPLPEFFVTALKEYMDSSKNAFEVFFYNRGYVPKTEPSGGLIDFDGDGALESAYDVGVYTFSPNGPLGASNGFPGQNLLFLGGEAFYSEEINGDIYQNFVLYLAPVNNDTCRSDPNQAVDFPGPYNVIDESDPNRWPRLIDGFALGQPGWVEGTPTAVITDNRIDQIVSGGSMQLNWSLDHHKVMVGASIDAARATYLNTQQLGFLTADRHAFLAPDLAHPQFGDADAPISNNDFGGTSTTKSLYFSETWSPIDTLHITASGRYNHTDGKNVIATRYGFGAFQIGDVRSNPDEFDTCTSDEDCSTPRNYVPVRIKHPKQLQPAETEKFTYRSFNPSIGMSWQARETLNVYGNVSRGARTPSVIELGCAFDKTPVFVGSDPNNPAHYWPKSIFENRSCSLPTTLSGDPFLPQIRSTSYEVGLRGAAGENAQWNVALYQTDLKDDIYFVARGNGQGFFDTIGNTRRRGVETGLSGRKERFGFSINYSMTDATFEDDFLMMNQDNSSAFNLNGIGQVIRVRPGSRMPGVALHNLNASVSYDLTDDWTIGFSVVAHSDSYVRGNENNEHRQGVARTVLYTTSTGTVSATRQPTRNPGSVPGYAVFNFMTSYKLGKGLTAGLLINNLFDTEYFTAGRLGRNPFSPSILGAIGPDGYNHNSGDWLSTNFIAPGAPRGVWFTLRYSM